MSSTTSKIVESEEAEEYHLIIKDCISKLSFDAQNLARKLIDNGVIITASLMSQAVDLIYSLEDEYE